MNLDGLDMSILGPAFVAGLLVLATHVPLGMEVLKRGIIFIDLAIAQIAGLGVILAHHYGWDSQTYAVQFAAMASALSGALFLSVMEKYWKHNHEALIGVVFILAASAGILLIADNPQGGEHLKDLLIGQILWVNWQQLIPTAIITIIILSLWLVAKPWFSRTGFYLLFALAVTSSVQLVGVYLVFASLIIPALAVSGLDNTDSLKGPHFRAYIIGVAGYAAGLVVSAMLDLPTGAVIVWSIACISIVYKLLMSINTKPLEKP